MRVILWCAALLLLGGCHKAIDAPLTTNALVDTAGFINYTINAGAHYASQNPYKAVETSSLNFIVRFDSSAIYKCAQPENQYDINKLYGFSDNNAPHHAYSARFGWRWSDGALRVFAYVYNNSKLISEELGTVPLGAAIKCTINVNSNQYLFQCNEYRRALPRQSTTPKGTGYQLYPYFGGDETAPHAVRIRIKALN